MKLPCISKQCLYLLKKLVIFTRNKGFAKEVNTPIKMKRVLYYKKKERSHFQCIFQKIFKCKNSHNGFQKEIHYNYSIKADINSRHMSTS